MKKQLFFIAIASLFSALASAADLYVRDFGAGGAYPSIGAAIAAASDGDRIIIRPKSGGIPYLESLTVNKSLSFVSETNFTKYLIQGTISITPLAGRIVTFNNLNCTSSITVSAGTTGGRTILNVFNSTIAGINAGQANTSLYASGCTASGTITLSHGRCTANSCSGISLSTTTSDTNFATDDIEIIANVIINSIAINQTNYNFKLLNNYLTQGNISTSNIRPNSNNEIRNNTINTSSGGGSYAIYIYSDYSGFISILNNVLTSSSSYKIYNSSSAVSVYAFYNMSNGTFNLIGVASASTNIANAGITLNNSTYTVSGANVNAGYPEDEYADLDLSANDIGNYGGSNSWANYWPTAVGNKPQVNYLNTPRRIYTGTTTMSATATGNSK